MFHCTGSDSNSVTFWFILMEDVSIRMPCFIHPRLHPAQHTPQLSPLRAPPSTDSKGAFVLQGSTVSPPHQQNLQSPWKDL